MTTISKGSSRTTSCPRCGHEAWPIAYGMVPPSVQEENPRVVYAGCVMSEEWRPDPATGEPRYGTPEWECQKSGCRHRWW
ncbi:hypothetical protein ACX80U_03650 [Arthrobacter sp. TmT3-37]